MSRGRGAGRNVYTPRDLAARLRTSGLEVPEGSIWTSELATAADLIDELG